MGYPFKQVNAFTDRPFAGNPAAVVRLDNPAPDSWMQLVARDFNLSETAFLVPTNTSQREWNLRWFTPTSEVDLCGHATLAGAHALREWSIVDEGEVRFHTRSGVLIARFESDEITLNFPCTPPKEIEVLPDLPQALGAAPEEVLWCGRSRFDIVLQLEKEEAVAKLNPDFAALRSYETRGVAITARSNGEEHDFVSRFFAPRVGIDEDPVTGSAHCALAPFWSQRLHKTKMHARQISPRGGELRLQVLDERVELSGKSVTILQGEVMA